jgi:hypothetical protein
MNNAIKEQSASGSQILTALTNYIFFYILDFGGITVYAKYNEGN